jgi:hypothetical protein
MTVIWLHVLNTSFKFTGLCVIISFREYEPLSKHVLQFAIAPNAAHANVAWWTSSNTTFQITVNHSLNEMKRQIKMVQYLALTNGLVSDLRVIRGKFWKNNVREQFKLLNTEQRYLSLNNDINSRYLASNERLKLREKNLE